MSITPDVKDWTWVLERPCAECGFDPSTVDARAVPATVRASLPRWSAVLARPDATARPAPDVWSPTEYGCHVRDVFAVFAERVALMLDQDDPLFANWDQDETALVERYDLQEPAAVSCELSAAGERFAALVEVVPDDGWPRPGRRSNGSRFTVATLVVYFLHDLVHHLHDVDA